MTEVKKAFGGDEDGGYSSLPRGVYNSYRSNANAYMLMYRQSIFPSPPPFLHAVFLSSFLSYTLLVEPDRNKKPMSATEIPEPLRTVVEEENGAAKQKKKAEEMEREMVKMKVCK